MFSPEVLARAASLKLREHDLIIMVHKAAICSLPGWNRRYHEYVFQINDFCVTDISVLDKPDHAGRIAVKLLPGEFLVYDECGDCRGVGCEFCEGGQVARKRRIN